jgi:hypothetical protein
MTTPETSTSTPDWLASTALAAIEAARPDLAGWVRTKAIELADADRLQALRWVVRDLDAGNQAIVADALGVTLPDLRATARVLQAI